MDTDKIKQVIDSGETQEVEFKESFHSSQKISELMCGFANTYGGVIILGVTKNKEVIGVSGNLDEIQQKISSSAQAVSPPILPSIEVHEIDSKKIIAITIQRAIDNSFHTFQGILWAKVGSTLKRIEGNVFV